MSCGSSRHRWPVKDKSFHAVGKVSFRNTASIISGGHLRTPVLGFWTLQGRNQPVWLLLTSTRGRQQPSVDFYREELPKGDHLKYKQNDGSWERRKVSLSPWTHLSLKKAQFKDLALLSTDNHWGAVWYVSKVGSGNRGHHHTWKHQPLFHFGTMYWAFLVAQMVKNLPVIQEMHVQSLGGENPLKEEMATHSGILAWRIP